MASGDQSKRKLEILSQLSNHRSDIKAKKQVLTEQIAESKEALKSKVKDKVNVPKMLNNKVRSVFGNTPNKWFIGSAIGGLVLSKFALNGVGPIFRKGKSAKSSRGLLFTIAGLAARPMVKKFVMGKVKDYVAAKFLQPQRPKQIYYDEQTEYRDYPSSNKQHRGH